MNSFHSVSIVFVSFFIQTLSGIVFYLIVARTLPTVEVGAITLFISFAGIFTTAFAMNFDTGFTHFISYFKIKREKYSIPSFFMIITAIVMFTSFIVIASVSNLIATVFFHSSAYTDIIILLGGYVSASIGLTYMVSILQGIQYFRLAAVSNMMFSVLSTGIPIGMAIFKLPIEIISAGFVIGAGISFILSLSFVIGVKLNVTHEENGFNTKFLAYVIPVFLGSLASSLMNTIDRVILPALTNLTLSAVYSYSLTIATIVTAITYPFSFFLLPKISGMFGAASKVVEKKYTQASLELFYYIALPASLGATLLSKPLLEILVGGIYASHYMVLQIMVFSYSFFSFRPILSSILLGNRKTRIYLYSGIAALGSNLIISLTLIPLFGIYGAVIASVSAWAVSTIPRMVALDSLLDSGLSLFPFIKMWINALIMSGTILLSSKIFNLGLLSLFIPVMVGIVSYLVLSIANRPFSKDARNLVNSMIGNNNPSVRLLLTILIGTEE